jgi:hypothetical protein
LKPDFSSEVKAISEGASFNAEPGELAEIALHSLKHAFLVLAPMYSGFEPEKFHGSYDQSQDGKSSRVFVYDTDEGGNGGFAALMHNRQTFVKMLREIRNRLDCPTRECSEACKLCLFIKNCGNVNRKLNRHLLKRLQIFN